MFKIIRFETPAYLYNRFIPLNAGHRHNTRNKNLILFPIHQTANFELSFTYRAARLWNQLPNDIKNLLSITSFKKALEIWLTNQNL